VLSLAAIPQSLDAEVGRKGSSNQLCCSRTCSLVEAKRTFSLCPLSTYSRRLHLPFSAAICDSLAAHHCHEQTSTARTARVSSGSSWVVYIPIVKRGGCNQYRGCQCTQMVYRMYQAATSPGVYRLPTCRDRNLYLDCINWNTARVIGLLVIIAHLETLFDPITPLL